MNARTSGGRDPIGAPVSHDIAPARESLPSDMLMPDPEIMSPATPLEPEIEPAAIRTQAVYRLLTMRGLEPPEAGNMTAFIVGLHVHKTPWTLTQVNRMLFLRELYASEAWGGDERRPA